MMGLLRMKEEQQKKAWNNLDQVPETIDHEQQGENNHARLQRYQNQPRRIPHF